jgi:Fe-S cluster assembly ATP-binding protein
VVLMGANGSGKSAGHGAGRPQLPRGGRQRCLGGTDLLGLPAHERARAGLFLSFQSPPDVPGVKNNLFIRTALNAVREARGQEPQDAFDFLSSAKRGAPSNSACPRPCWPPRQRRLLGRRAQAQRAAATGAAAAARCSTRSTPGMDVDGVRAVVELVQRLRAQGTAFIVVSHYLQMIEQLQPDAVLRLDQGCIAETGDIELARRIARTGFARRHHLEA